MKKIILLALIAMSSLSLLSQNKPYYVILTSKPYTYEEYHGVNVPLEGIYRDTLKPDKKYKELIEVHKSPSIHFELASSSRKISETFRYADYDVEKLKALRGRRGSEDARVYPEEILDTKVMPLSFLNGVTPIDLDKEFPTMTYESAKQLLEPLRGKRIYIIDRNDITDKTVRLIGVRYVTHRRTKIPVD